MGLVSIWAGLRLFGQGAFDGLLRGLSAALKWLFSDWRNGPLVVCALLWAAHALLITPRLRDDLAETRADLNAERAAHIATVENYTAASAKAQADAEANAARVKAEQERITDATVGNYRSNLAVLRARFDRLRARDAAAGNSGRADPAGLPGPGDAASGAAAPTGEDRLPAARSLSLDDALIASEQALQLGALIDWVEAQTAVRFTPEGKR